MDYVYNGCDKDGLHALAQRMHCFRGAVLRATSESTRRAEMEQRLRFEMLLADVCAQFVNVPAEDLDSKIENAQRLICESLAVDHSSVWQVSENDPDQLVMTHAYRDPKLTPLPSRAVLKEYFPWAQSKILNKQTISVFTHRKNAEKELLGMSRKLIEAQEQERSRIGRELHDDIGQRLALVAVELQQLHENSVILPDVRSRMGELQKQISEIAVDTQSLSHELHSAKLQYLGLATAMRGFCREFGEQQKLEIDFNAHDLPSPLSPDISLCLFRVLQEALHNSAKHSGVRHFEVRLWGTSDEIHLTVKDSGTGFDREATKVSRGLGLISMEERLKLVKGTLSIESQPKRGTTIHAQVPLSSGSNSIRAAG